MKKLISIISAAAMMSTLAVTSVGAADITTNGVISTTTVDTDAHTLTYTWDFSQVAADKTTGTDAFDVGNGLNLYNLTLNSSGNDIYKSSGWTPELGNATSYIRFTPKYDGTLKFTIVTTYTSGKIPNYRYYYTTDGSIPVKTDDRKVSNNVATKEYKMTAGTIYSIALYSYNLPASMKDITYTVANYTEPTKAEVSASGTYTKLDEYIDSVKYKGIIDDLAEGETVSECGFVLVNSEDLETAKSNNYERTTSSVSDKYGVTGTFAKGAGFVFEIKNMADSNVESIGVAAVPYVTLGSGSIVFGTACEANDVTPVE